MISSSINRLKVNRISSSSIRYASTLVVAEHDNTNISAATLSAITAASKLKNTINLLLLGSSSSLSAITTKATTINGVSKVLVVESDTFKNNISEDIALTVSHVIKAGDYSHVVVPATNTGKNFLPRTAAMLDASPISDIVSIESADTFKRPMYAGNAIATVQMTDKIKFLTVRPTAFEKAQTTGGNATTEKVSLSNENTNASLSTFISANSSSSDRPDLGTARVVVSGGRGLKNGENFAMLTTMADKLKGAVGASRAAVDSGFVPNDYQVGQTGKVVAPDLYIAVGISGAIQHLSGMKDSKTIVAINKDKEAPIFQVADYGLVDDLFKVVPEINSKL